MKVQLVVIDRDMVTKPAKLVWPWEVPVLQEKFGASKVREISEAEQDVDPPDAALEYERLTLTYGEDKKGTAYVEHAYGRGHAGVAALCKRIASFYDSPAPDAEPRRGRPKKSKAA